MNRHDEIMKQFEQEMRQFEILKQTSDSYMKKSKFFAIGICVFVPFVFLTHGQGVIPWLFVLAQIICFGLEVFYGQKALKVWK